MLKGKSICTLGTSTRSPEEFVELLNSHAVEAVADVRRFPTSRFEHFRREELAKLLAEAGIEYIYVGQELGGYRQGGYQAFVTSSQFDRGMKKLREAAATKKVAILCAERFPWRCHRRFISSELEKQGWQVIHIIDKGRDWLPRKSGAQE